MKHDIYHVTTLKCAQSQTSKILVPGRPIGLQEFLMRYNQAYYLLALQYQKDQTQHQALVQNK